MYRAHLIVQVKWGRFKEHLEICEKMNDLARNRGWAESTFWVPTAGVVNQVVLETEYANLATMEREMDAYFSDAEAGQLTRSAVDCIVEGSARSELFQTAPTLA